MKNRKLISAVLALSMVWAVVSLGFRGGFGVVPALSDGPPPQDFNLTSAKLHVIHETANQCFNGSLSCISPVDGLGRIWFSDSYEVNAKLSLSHLDFKKDLTNNTIFVILANGTCADLFGVKQTGFVSWIPGNDLKAHTNGNETTTYRFEGNVLAIVEQNFNSTSFPVFQHLSFDLLVPTQGLASLEVEGNGGLCSITGPTAFAISLGFPGHENNPDKVPDSDASCVDIPSPILGTLDISQGVCPFF